MPLWYSLDSMRGCGPCDLGSKQLFCDFAFACWLGSAQKPKKRVAFLGPRNPSDFFGTWEKRGDFALLSRKGQQIVMLVVEASNASFLIFTRFCGVESRREAPKTTRSKICWRKSQQGRGNGASTPQLRPSLLGLSLF